MAKPKSPVRLKDIATDLDLSTVTVSKVLRGLPDIGPKTRARVLKRMAELDYRPNMLARGLASGRSFTVGLIVPDLVHPFFGEFARSLAGHLRDSDLALILASSEEDPEIERREIRTLTNRGVDVLLVASCQSAKRPSLVTADAPPLLLIDRNLPSLKTSFIGTNDRLAGELAARHFVGIGRRRVAHIGGSGTSTAMDRLKGFQRALLASGLKLPSSYIVTRERFEESGDSAGYRAMQDLLSLKQPPDAVFCYNDLTAIGAIHATLQAGRSVPGDIAFIGCGNLRYAAYLSVPLTSIDQGIERLAKAAATRTLSLATTPLQPAAVTLIEPKLIVRHSTNPA